VLSATQNALYNTASAIVTQSALYNTASAIVTQSALYNTASAISSWQYAEQITRKSKTLLYIY